MKTEPGDYEHIICRSDGEMVIRGLLVKGKALDPHQNKMICVLFYNFPAQPNFLINQSTIGSNHIGSESFYLLLYKIVPIFR